MNLLSRYLAIGVIACVSAAAAQAQIVFYEHPDFKGKAIRVSGSVSNLRDRGFSDMPSSVKVLTGTWEICVDTNFRGSCSVLQPGQYPEPRDMGMKHVSSVRNVSDAQSGGGYSGSGSSEYRRGYNDALKGRRFDNDRHPRTTRTAIARARMHVGAVHHPTPRRVGTTSTACPTVASRSCGRSAAASAPSIHEASR